MDDINQSTRRRQAELLTEDIDFYKSLFDMFPDIVYALDCDGYCITANLAAAQLTGYTLEDAIEIPYEQVIVPEDLPRVEQHFRAALQGVSQSYDVTIVHKDGHRMELQVTNTPIMVGGEVQGVFGIAKDMTERRREQERLREIEVLYKLISENSQDIISYSTPDGICRYVSPAIRTLLGYDPEEMIGTFVLDFYHPDDVQAMLARTFEDSDTFTCRVRHRNGEYYWFETTVKVIRNEQGEHLLTLGVGRDISERKRAEELLLQSEKLSIAGQLAAGIAHEIRNPLTALKGFTQLMKSGSGKTEEYLTIMTSELNRIELILDELLMLAKPQADQFRAEDVAVIVEEVVALIRSQAILYNIEVATAVEPNLPRISCDRNQLKQVFINFLKNAIEAMPSGGQILIDVRRSDESNVAVRFTDQGVGIPADCLDKIGEPFYTTKEKGTGLGLMVSKKIIENHRGQLMVHSTPGVGTQIEVTLPTLAVWSL